MTAQWFRQSVLPVATPVAAASPWFQGTPTPITPSAQQSSADSAGTDIDRFIKQTGFSEYASVIKDELGVNELGDLEYVERSDLADAGMSDVDQQRFMAAYALQQTSAAVS